MLLQKLTIVLWLKQQKTRLIYVILKNCLITCQLRPFLRLMKWFESTDHIYTTAPAEVKSGRKRVDGRLVWQ